MIIKTEKIKMLLQLLFSTIQSSAKQTLYIPNKFCAYYVFWEKEEAGLAMIEDDLDH